MNKAGETPLSQNKERNVLIRLEQARDKYGCLPDELITDLARSLNVSVGEVYGVATFYSFLSTKSQGRNTIKVCKSLPCYLKNSRMIIESLENELGIKPGETTKDGRFSLELSNCIGLCDMAPAILINDNAHGYLTPKNIPEILNTYK